jgi:hypothetical protein
VVLVLRRTGAGAADDGATTSSACCHNDQLLALIGIYVLCRSYYSSSQRVSVRRRYCAS